MSSLNKVCLLGRVGNPPEVRFLPSGDLVANFSMATDEKYKTKSGEQREEVTWTNVAVFGKLAEIVKEYVGRGKQLYIEGKLVHEEWEKDGVKRSRSKVVLSGPQAKLILLGGSSNDDESEDPEPRQAPTKRQNYAPDD